MKDYDELILDCIEDQICKFLAEMMHSALEDPTTVKLAKEVLKEIVYYREAPKADRDGLEGFGLLGKLLPRLWV